MNDLGKVIKLLPVKLAASWNPREKKCRHSYGKPGLYVGNWWGGVEGEARICGSGWAVRKVGQSVSCDQKGQCALECVHGVPDHVRLVTIGQLCLVWF